MSYTALPLSPVISNIVANLFVLTQRTIELDAAYGMLQAQCLNLQAQVAAQAHVYEKTAQHKVRAEIAAFLRERGESRIAAGEFFLLATCERLSSWRVLMTWRIFIDSSHVTEDASGNVSVASDADGSHAVSVFHEKFPVRQECMADSLQDGLSPEQTSAHHYVEESPLVLRARRRNAGSMGAVSRGAPLV